MSYLQRRVLCRLYLADCSVESWRLRDAESAAMLAIQAALTDLADRGLAEVSPMGWHLTPTGRALFDRLEG